METRKLLVFDTTLRDGEQQPRLCFRDDEKIAFCYQLEKLGVFEIDLMPSIDAHERMLIKLLNDTRLRDKIGVATMIDKKYVDQAVEVNARLAYTFVHISDDHMGARNKTREQNLEDVVTTVDYARSKGLVVDFCGGVGTEADNGYVRELLTTLKPKIRFYQTCDTNGMLAPEESASHIRELVSIMGEGRVAVHYHNDKGIAVENVIAALQNGAVGFDGTFTGIGERAGNVATERVLCALRDKHGILVEGIKYDEIPPTVEMVRRMCRGILPPEVRADRRYPNRSGIHGRALLGKRDAFHYQYTPEAVEELLFFGKHSGKSNYKLLFGDQFTDAEYEQMRDEVKRLAREQLRDFTAAEIRAMYGKKT